MTKHIRPTCPLNKVTFIDGKFYFNSVELRAKALLLRERIVGLTQRKSYNVWHLSCTTPDCTGVCAFGAGYDDKGIDYDRCARCKAPDIGKILRQYIDNKWEEKVVVASTSDTNTKKPKYYVKCSSCEEHYPATFFTGAKRRIHCFDCHKQYRTLFGEYVASDSIWSIRHLVRGVKRRPGKERVNVSWIINCPTAGCEGTLEYRNGVSSVCVTCRATARAHAPYAALYKVHLRQDAARARRQPKYPVSQLSFLQFQQAMLDTTCHYCGDQVPRYERLRRLTPDGKRMSSCVFLDRLDSMKPYAVGNIVTCCVGCNLIKGAYLTEQEMLYIGARRRGDAGSAAIADEKLQQPYPHVQAKAIGFRRKKVVKPPKP